MNAPRSLEELLQIIRTGADVDMAELPSFGGTDASGPSGVWSWDAKRVLVGTCGDDMKIISRAAWGEQLAERSTAAATLGRLGGSARSEAKTAAAVKNGKLGGRPRKEGKR